MKIKSRAQGSMEFLMTYGWALVIIIIVSVVAWRWGVFSFAGTVQPGQYGFWGVTPADYKMSSTGELTLSLQNGVGANVSVNYVTATVGSFNKTVDGVGVIMSSQKKVVYLSGLDQGLKGDRFDVFVVINYSDSRMQEHRERLSSGIMWGSYE